MTRSCKNLREMIKMYEQKYLDEYIEENPARDSDIITEELVILDISENAGFDFDACSEDTMDEEFFEIYNAHMDED